MRNLSMQSAQKAHNLAQVLRPEYFGFWRVQLLPGLDAINMFHHVAYTRHRLSQSSRTRTHRLVTDTDTEVCSQKTVEVGRRVANVDIEKSLSGGEVLKFVEVCSYDGVIRLGQATRTSLGLM